METLAADLLDLKEKVKEGQLAKLVSSAAEQRSLAQQLKATNTIITVLKALCQVGALLLLRPKAFQGSSLYRLGLTLGSPLCSRGLWPTDGRGAGGV